MSMKKILQSVSKLKSEKGSNTLLDGSRPLGALQRSIQTTRAFREEQRLQRLQESSKQGEEDLEEMSGPPEHDKDDKDCKCPDCKSKQEMAEHPEDCDCEECKGKKHGDDDEGDEDGGDDEDLDEMSMPSASDRLKRKRQRKLRKGKMVDPKKSLAAKKAAKKFKAKRKKATIKALKTKARLPQLSSFDDWYSASQEVFDESAMDELDALIEEHGTLGFMAVLESLYEEDLNEAQFPEVVSGINKMALNLVTGWGKIKVFVKSNPKTKPFFREALDTIQDAHDALIALGKKLANVSESTDPESSLIDSVTEEPTEDLRNPIQD